MRRVRQISPTNRSDGFLGSDLTVDDGGPGFGGKPEDFTWKLIGAREALVLADPRSLDGTSPRRGLPDGGVIERWPPDQKTVGYQDPPGLAPLGPDRSRPGPASGVGRRGEAARPLLRCSIASSSGSTAKRFRVR